MNVHRHTPIEIIFAGVQQTRETFADLYVELDRTQRAAAWVWHRAYVDATVSLLDGVERLPEHPAEPGFGGNDLVPRPRPVAVDRLTDAGLVLFGFGARLALLERSALMDALVTAQAELDAMRRIPPRADREHQTSLRARALDALDRRRRNQEDLASRPSAPLAPWPDVPTAVPGLGTFIPPAEPLPREPC
jgi:hypothetical protein